MEVKKDLKDLLKRGYSVINDLNKSSDMTPKQIVLKQNGVNSQNQARELISNLHQLVNAFDNLLQKFLIKAIDEKMKTLDDHSKEVTKFVDYVSNLCLIAENMIKEDNLQVVHSFGPEVKADFLKSLKECRELKLIDYETFTSLDLDVDLSGLLQNSFVNIVGWNPECMEKEIVHSLGFGNLEKDVILSVNQTKMNKKRPHINDFDCNDSASLFTKSENNIGASNNLLNPQTKQQHPSNRILPAIETLNNINRPFLHSDTDKVLLPCYQKTHTPFHTAEQYCNVPSCLPSSYVSTQCRTNSTVANLKSSIEHAQSSKPNIILSSNYQSQVNSKPTIIVLSDENNKDLSKSITEVLKNLKIEVTEDEEIKKTESTVQQNMPLFENCITGTAEHYPGSFKPSILKCIKTETASSDIDNFISTMNVGFPAISSHDMCKTGDEEISQLKIKSWNLSNIEPLKMTFDIRTVLPANKSRSPEIVGRYVKTIRGDRSTRFSHPIGVTVTVDDLVVIADTFNHLVRVMSNNKLVLTIGGNQDGVKFCRPSAVVTDNEGNIYVKDDISIQIFNRKGKLLQTVGKLHFCQPYGLALAEIKNEPVLVVIDLAGRQSAVYHYYIRRNQLKSYPYIPSIEYNVPDSKIRFLAVHNNSMLVSDLGASTMYLSDLDGKLIRVFGGYGDRVGEFKAPSGVTVDAAGNWIVGDSKNNRLQVFTNDGQVLATIKLISPIRRPSGIHLSPDGHLYVINYLDSTINVYELHY